MNKALALPDERIFRKIHMIRGQKVLLDSDLADLYDVETKKLKQAVRRNIHRFPKDFMFELSIREAKALRQNGTRSNSLRSHFVTLKTTQRGRHSKYVPMAFTEQGVAMLSSVLNSKKAIAINIQIMRLFVRIRQMVFSYKNLLKKIENLETSDAAQNKDIVNIYALIKELLEPEIKNKKPIGFKTNHS